MSNKEDNWSMPVITTNAAGGVVRRTVANRMNRTQIVKHYLKDAGVALTAGELFDKINAEGNTITMNDVTNALRLMSGQLNGSEYRNDIKRVKATKKQKQAAKAKSPRGPVVKYAYKFNPAGKQRSKGLLLKTYRDNVTQVKVSSRNARITIN